jgi:hypothetical protein
MAGKHLWNQAKRNTNKDEDAEERRRIAAMCVAATFLFAGLAGVGFRFVRIAWRKTCGG